MLMDTRLGRGETYHDGFPPIKSHNPLTTRRWRSRDKLNSLYLYYQNTYSHKTGQNDDLPSTASTHKFVGSYSHVITQ